VWRLVLFISFYLPCTAQDCLRTGKYSGQPAVVVTDSLTCPPGSVYEVDWCTSSVPDRLTFYIGEDTVSFMLGGHSGASDIIHGPITAVYENGTVTVNGQPDPADLPDCNWSTEVGLSRIIINIPDGVCKLVWSMEANESVYTAYTFCLRQIKLGSYRRDTLQVPACSPQWPTTRFVDCRWLVTTYADSSIQGEPVLLHPTCPKASDGGVYFPEHPSFNQQGLGVGLHTITISNSVCSKDYTVDLQPQQLCRYYAPNALSANGDGLNDTFVFFTETELPYDLQIYTRWGGLLFEGPCLTNLYGWTPDPAVQPGVYVWVVRCLGAVYTGTVTVLR
jgi:hypothetical protein